MNNAPRDELRRLLDQYGQGLINDPMKCEALLRDFCGEHRREIRLLMTALAERIPQDLLGSVSTVPREVLISSLVRRLEHEAALNSEAAAWAVESWIAALGIVFKQRSAGPTAAPAPVASPVHQTPVPQILGRADKMSGKSVSPSAFSVSAAGAKKPDPNCFTCESTGTIQCTSCGGERRVECDTCDGDKTVECDVCSGVGAITCKECDGDGTINCEKCDGSGSLTCPVCDGGGTLANDRECRRCKGTGSVDCPKCAAVGSWDCTKCSCSGEVPCTHCAAVGQKQCPKCNREGSLICAKCGGSGEQKCPTCMT